MNNKFQKKYNLAKYVQMFAEDGEQGDGQGQQQAKTYSEDDYNKLKAMFDKASSELAEKKKQEKAKLGEEEKKALEQKEKDEKLSNLERELLGIKMSKEFVVAGFDEATTNEIIESFNKGDSVEFAKTITTKIKALIENARKEEQAKFQQSQTTPPASGGTKGKELDPMVKKYIENMNNGNSNKAKELYLNKK